MSLGKNVKRSVTYEFELTHCKLLSNVSRYKGYSKLYQLNLSKMLLKYPDSPFRKREEALETQDLLVVDNCKFQPPIKNKSLNNTTNKCDTTLSRSKAQSFKKSIRDSLLYKSEFQTQPESKMDIFEFPEESINTQIRQNPIESQKSDSTTSSSLKLVKFEAPKQMKKYLRLYELSPESKRQDTLFMIENKQYSKNNIGEPTEPIRSQNNECSIPKELKPQIRKRFSINQHQVTRRTKMMSKKLFFPDIKCGSVTQNQTHIINISTKSNIPLIFRDPQLLKHIKAEAYAIMEYPSGNLVLSNRGINQYEIASLTKIMTFYTTLRILKRYQLDMKSEKIKITDYAMEMSGTSAQILAGEVYTIQQLFYGLMLPSGNDAAMALAEWGGNKIISQHKNNIKIDTTEDHSLDSQEDIMRKRIAIFINEMNIHAKQLCLNSTRYANPHGLPHNQARSCAVDVARLCIECLNDSIFIKVISTQRFRCSPYQFINPEKKRSVQWRNTNKLLRREGFMGIKTGITVTAGPCLASAYKFRDKIYVCIVLRTSKVSRRFKQTRKLLAWSLQKLYKDSLTLDEAKHLNNLRKNKPDLDSDYSEDEQEFNYDEASPAEFKKRSNIVNYQV